jgi:hypothetical protein
MSHSEETRSYLISIPLPAKNRSFDRKSPNGLNQALACEFSRSKVRPRPDASIKAPFARAITVVNASVLVGLVRQVATAGNPSALILTGGQAPQDADSLWYFAIRTLTNVLNQFGRRALST